MIHLVRLLTEDGKPAKAAETSQSIWGQTKLEIMQRCCAKNKLLPYSTYRKGSGYHVWTNMFRVDFEIKAGICK